MFYVKDNDIYLTRGDTLALTVTVLSDGVPYIPKTGEVVRFALKRRYEDADENVIINKTLDNSGLQLILTPDDTKDLEFARYYVYDIQLTNQSGNVDTFIKGKFYLGEEVL